MSKSYKIYEKYDDIVWFYNDESKNISKNGERKIIDSLWNWIFCTEVWYSIWNTDYSEYVLFIPKNSTMNSDEIINLFNENSEKIIWEKIDLSKCVFEREYDIADKNYVMKVYKKWITWVG